MFILLTKLLALTLFITHNFVFNLLVDLVPHLVLAIFSESQEQLKELHPIHGLCLLRQHHREQLVQLV
jgi:hypothetical protein